MGLGALSPPVLISNLLEILTEMPCLALPFFLVVGNVWFMFFLFDVLQVLIGLGG